MSMLTRYRPFRPMHALRRDLDRIFSEFDPWFADEQNGDKSAVWMPHMDLSETDTEFLVKMDLPGIDKDQVRVNVEDNMLTIGGERKEEQKEKTENFLRVERSYGSFYRSIPLPKATMADKVKAEFKNGVLTVHLPKSLKNESHKIKIT